MSTDSATLNNQNQDNRPVPSTMESESRWFTFLTCLSLEDGVRMIASINVVGSCITLVTIVITFGLLVIHDDGSNRFLKNWHDFIPPPANIFHFEEPIDGMDILIFCICVILYCMTLYLGTVLLTAVNERNLEDISRWFNHSVSLVFYHVIVCAAGVPQLSKLQTSTIVYHIVTLLYEVYAILVVYLFKRNLKKNVISKSEMWRRLL